MPKKRRDEGPPAKPLQDLVEEEAALAQVLLEAEETAARDPSSDNAFLVNTLKAQHAVATQLRMAAENNQGPRVTDAPSVPNFHALALAPPGTNPSAALAAQKTKATKAAVEASRRHTKARQQREQQHHELEESQDEEYSPEVIAFGALKLGATMKSVELEGWVKERSAKRHQDALAQQVADQMVADRADGLKAKEDAKRAEREALLLERKRRKANSKQDSEAAAAETARLVKKAYAEREWRRIDGKVLPTDGDDFDPMRHLEEIVEREKQNLLRKEAAEALQTRRMAREAEYQQGLLDVKNKRRQAADDELLAKQSEEDAQRLMKEVQKDEKTAKKSRKEKDMLLQAADEQASATMETGAAAIEKALEAVNKQRDIVMESEAALVKWEEHAASKRKTLHGDVNFNSNDKTEALKSYEVHMTAQMKKVAVEYAGKRKQLVELKKEMVRMKAHKVNKALQEQHQGVIDAVQQEVDELDEREKNLQSEYQIAAEKAAQAKGAAFAQATTGLSNARTTLSKQRNHLKMLEERLSAVENASAQKIKEGQDQFAQAEVDRFAALQKLGTIQAKLAKIKKLQRVAHVKKQEASKQRADARDAEAAVAVEFREEHRRDQLEKEAKLRAEQELAEHKKQLEAELLAAKLKEEAEADNSDPRNQRAAEPEEEAKRPKNTGHWFKAPVVDGVRWIPPEEQKIQEEIKRRQAQAAAAVEKSRQELEWHKKLVGKKKLEVKAFTAAREKRIADEEAARELEMQIRFDAERARRAKKPPPGQVTKVWSGSRTQLLSAVRLGSSQRPRSRAMLRSRQQTTGSKLAPLPEEGPSPHHKMMSATVDIGTAMRAEVQRSEIRTPGGHQSLDNPRRNASHRLSLHRAVKKSGAVHWAMRDMVTTTGKPVVFGHFADQGVRIEPIPNREACYKVWHPKSSPAWGGDLTAGMGTFAGSRLRAFR